MIPPFYFYGQIDIITDHLVKSIETKLGWGAGDTWSNKDFEELSERILATTNKRLSVTTLKRIWGRAERVANPSAATLDILSEFLGYTNWREFVQDHKSQKPEESVNKKSRASKIWIPIVGLIFVGSLVSFFWRTTSDTGKTSVSFNPDDYTFESRPVSDEIPNSVVFDYNALAAGENSKIEIQQYWDETKRMTIGREDSIATSIYYHPGFFKSKLVVDDSIVQQNDVFIATEDWLGMIEQEPRPIYLNRSDIIKDSTMAITLELVSAHNLDPRTSEVTVSFYLVKDFGELYTDNFEMAVTLKNDFEQGLSGACQKTTVYILYDGGAIGIPLSKKGCVSDLKLMAFDRYIDGKKNDLSGFGVDFNDYVDLKCVSKNRKLDILIDNTPVFSFDVPEVPKKIVGISIHFEGAGSVENAAFKNEEGDANQETP